MRGRGTTIRPKIRGQLLLARRQLPAIQRTVEELQRGNRLIVRNLVPSLVDTGEREIAILAGLAILNTVHEEGSIACSAELLAVREVGRKGDGLAAEPVADIICVTVDESDADWPGEDVLEVFDEVGPDKVASLLEGVVDFGVRLSVVEVNAEGVHDIISGEIVHVVAGRGGVLGWVADVVSAAAAEHVIRALCEAC